MKADKYESCRDCGKWEYAYPGCGDKYCYKLNDSISDLDSIPLGCPLPDWPEVDKSWLIHIRYELISLIEQEQTTYDYFTKQLRSIGVIVREG